MASRVTTLEAGHEFSLCEVSSFEAGIRLKRAMRERRRSPSANTPRGPSCSRISRIV